MKRVIHYSGQIISIFDVIEFLDNGDVLVAIPENQICGNVSRRILKKGTFEIN